MARWNGEQRIEEADGTPKGPRSPLWHLAYLIALHGFAIWGVMDAIRLVFGVKWPI